MKTALTRAVCMVAVLGAAWFNPTASAAPGDVQASFDLPCKYPAGLASDGQHLFVVDWRTAKVYALDPADGAAGRTWDAPTLKPHGLAYGGGKLFVADDHTGMVYALDPASGMVEHHFEAPGTRTTGLAYADGVLYLLERKSRRIYKVHPDDGTILGYFAVPDSACTCMTYDGKYLWVSNRIKDELYMVEPESGMVVAIVEAPGPYAAGLAWLGDHLWNVDFQTRKLYRLVLDDTPRHRLTDTRTARVECLWSLTNYGPGEVRDLTVNVALPDNLPNQRLRSEVRFSTSPTETVADRWGQRCARFELGTVPAGRKAAVSYAVDVEVSAIRYLILPEKIGTLNDIPEQIRQEYTVDGARYQIDSPYIRETVKKVVGDEQNPYWIARKVYNFVIDRLEYEMVGGWDVPEVVLKRGSGSCSEYTFAFVALCRAAGLPARYQGSLVVRGDDASVDEAFHRWAQVYLPGYGWVPVDANRGDQKSPADQARGFGELANRFLITTQSGGDSEYLAWGYNVHAQYRATGYCKIEEDGLALWEPLSPTDAPATD